MLPYTNIHPVKAVFAIGGVLGCTLLLLNTHYSVPTPTRSSPELADAELCVASHADHTFANSRIQGNKKDGFFKKCYFRRF